MLLGILLMLLGIGLSLSTTRLAELNSGLFSFEALQAQSYIETIIILAGFLMEVVGLFRR